MNLNSLLQLKHSLILLLILAGVTATAAPNKTFPSFKVGGYTMVDYDRYGAFYNKDTSESESHFELRRSKLSLDFRPHEDIKAQVQLSYNQQYRSDDQFELARVHVSYMGFPGIKLRLGKMKEPYSLEYQTSSKKLATIERSLITTAFAPGSNFGVQLYETKKDYTWALGGFQEEKEEGSASKYTEAISSRVTYALINEEYRVFHVGASLSLRDIKGQNLTFKERGEVNSAQKVIRSASFDADSLNILQLEAAWASRQWRLQGEVAVASIKQVDGNQWQYSGFYLQGSALLSGEHYRYKQGKFKGVKPNSSLGSWELVARFSGLDLRDQAVGSESSILLLGVNYYAFKRFRLMANLLMPSISGNVVNTNQSGNGISIRGQYHF